MIERGGGVQSDPTLQRFFFGGGGVSFTDNCMFEKVLFLSYEFR